MNRALSILVGLFAPLIISQAAYADQPVYGVGGSNGTGGIAADEPLLTHANSATLSNERRLRSLAAFLTFTDNPGNSSFDADFGVLPITNGGTNGATAQAGVNNLLGAISGNPAAQGDTVYFDGTNWRILHRGNDGDAIVQSGNVPTWVALGSGAPVGASYITVALDGTLTTERRLQGTANKITLTDGGSGGDLTLNVGTDIVQLTGAQTLVSKTLTSPSIGTSLIFELGTFDTTITASAPAANRAINFPDPGATAAVIYDVSAQTISGAKTFSAAPRFNANIQNSSGNTITLPSTAQTLATIAGTENLTGKTLTSAALATQLTLNQSSFNYTLNWANPAAARTYSIRDIGGVGNIAMDSGTPTGIAYGDGNKIVYLGAASTGNVPTYNGSAWTYSTPSSGGGFGGGGTAGAVNQGAATETTPLQIDATTFTQTVSTTWVPVSGTVINATSTYTANGTTNVGTGFSGGSAGGNGAGATPGMFVTNAGGSGGGGRGAGGAGGNGGLAGVSAPFSSYAASSGSGSATATGGAGGGRLTVCAVGAITIASGGSINATGGVGTADTANGAEGGGGGAGGIIILASQASITQTGTASVAGGAGGNGGASGTAYGGGGGGGGYYVRVSPSNTGAGGITVTGGAAGTANSGPGSAGSNGTAIAITATPNLPLIGMLENRDNLRMLTAFSRAHDSSKTELSLTDTQAVRALAAITSDSENFNKTCQLLQFGEDFQGSKVVQIDRSDRSEALRNAS